MKRFLLLALGLSVYYASIAQDSTARKAAILLRMIEKHHVAPRTIDSKWGRDVGSILLQKLDPHGIYFTSLVADSILKEAENLPAELRSRSNRFLSGIHRRYYRALAYSKGIVSTALQQPYRPSVSGMLRLSEGPDRFEPPSRLPAKLSGYVEYNLLEAMALMADNDSFFITRPLIAENETEVREQLKKKLLGGWKQLEEKPLLMHQFLEKAYLQSITSSFDPHSAYFSLADRNSFEEELSSESMMFGFALEEDDEGDIAIAGLRPGTAAWNSNEMHEDDKIVSMRAKGGQWINLKETPLEEIYALLDKQGSEEMEFTVKSPDGQTRVVKLRKELERKDDNAVRGWILEGEQKIGYISLPSFYTKLGSNRGTSCAEDLAQEIVKLKRDGIQGLILDLRYNGGGSLQEANDLLSLFIDAGPLGLLRVANGEVEVFKDVNRGTIFNGPLAVMINGASASASEIVAGTLQDFANATIVGAPSYGKATMQIIVPVDTSFTLQDLEEKTLLDKGSENGFVKLTMGKLYRINGSTAQATGVIPDVIISEEYQKVMPRESDALFALSGDTIIKPLTYKTNPKAWKSDRYQKFQSQISPLTESVRKSAYEVEEIPLEPAAFSRWYNSRYGNYDDEDLVESTPATNTAYKVVNSKQDADFNEMDTYRRDLDERLKKWYASDASIRTTFQLLQQIINDK